MTKLRLCLSGSDVGQADAAVVDAVGAVAASAGPVVAAAAAAVVEGDGDWVNSKRLRRP